jgi:hypothetical protein
MNLVIGKLYMVTSMHTRSIVSDNAGELGSYIGYLQLNDIVLFLGELNKSCLASTWLKILTSDGVVGYIGNYDSNNWQLVEAL